MVEKSPEINIAGRLIGADHPPVVVAEIGINHGGDLDVAIHIADKAIDSGAEIVKHQTHVVEDEMSEDAKSVIPGNADISIYKIMSACSLSENDERMLMDHIVKRNCIFMSTPFSRAALNRLVKFDVPAYKIGSGECNNYPLVELVAQQRKPVIVSTGMNSLESVQRTVDILERYGVPYALLHCTNLYPTPPHLVRLGGMVEMAERFPSAVIGLSDHCETNFPALGSISLGASIVERHFTDSKKRSGPDIVCSMDPDDLRDLIRGSKEIWSANRPGKGLLEEEKVTSSFAFASVVTTESIKKGDKFSLENVWVKRPSGGDFSAGQLDEILGKTAAKDIEADKQLKISDVSPR